MNLGELQTLIGSLTNDPNHDRYSVADIGTELDNSQNKWNLEAKLITNAVLIPVTGGVSQYSLVTYISSTPISFERVTYNKSPIKKRSKSYFDLYFGPADWTIYPGTPTDYFIEFPNVTTQYLTLYPVPPDGDTGLSISVEYLGAHTSMSSSDDTPFSFGNDSNYLLRPYDYGLAYDAAARLLLRDPSPANVEKSQNYVGIGNGVLAEVIQVFKSMNEEEPKRLRGGRQWVF